MAWTGEVQRKTMPQALSLSRPTPLSLHLMPALALAPARGAAALRRSGAGAARRPARMAPPRAGNVILEALVSTVALAVPVAVTALTAEDTDKEIARLQTADGLIPLGAAVAADAVAHSIPGELNGRGGACGPAIRTQHERNAKKIRKRG